MLQDYPAAVQYLDAKEIERYSRRLPSTLEGTLQVLAELLPLLGDELVPVWQSEPLPSQPVALVSFLDKSGEPLVAVVCESGLLWVANANDPEVHAALLIPEVGPEGERVRGLFACQALRPFGQWTELLIPVLPRKSTVANQDAQIYRALVSFQGGRVRLEPAVEDATRDRTRQPAGLPDEWPPLPLPDPYKYLLRRTEVFSGGVDALTLEDRLSDLDPDEETTLRLWGRHRSLDVQGRTQLVLRGRRNEREIYPLPHPVKSGVVVPSAPSAKSFQVVLAQEGRRLEGLVFDGKVKSCWHQRLQYEPVAIDCSLETAPKGGWPDLFIALDDRYVVRFGWRGAASLGELRKSLVENLGKMAGLSTPAMWTTWTCQQFRLTQESRPRDRSRTLRRVLHYLAADRALGAATGDDLETVKRDLVQQVAEEVETDLLLPAAWRLLEALEAWESDQKDRVPDLVWAFYEKVPFSIQELFDSHLRSGAGKRLRNLNPGYDELLTHSTNVLSSYRDLKDPLRDKGILLLQALEPYATASIMPPRRDFRFRHMVRLDIDGQLLLAAVGAHEIRLYRVKTDEIGLDEVEEAYTDLGDLFTTQFVQAVDCGDDRVLVLLGSLQGKLAAWDPTPAFRADEAQSPLLECKEIGGSLSAAVEWSSSQGKGRALVAQNRHQGACLLPVWVRPGGGIEIEAEIETGLEWIQSLQTMVHGGRPLLALGAGEELALLAGNLEPGKPAVPTERFPLGASVSVVACLTSEEHLPLVTACTREGQVFCIELGSELRPKRFRWIYQVPRGASGILSRADAQMPLGIISTQGTVTLLSSNGDLVYDYRRPDPIDAGILLTIRDKSWLIVGRHSGGLTILLANRGADQILKDARRQLARVPPAEIETQPPANEAREVGWLFARFEDGADPCSLYEAVDFEISRSVLVHLTSRDPNRVHSQARDWVEKLSLRDLAEFLRRLPSGKAREWVLQSWERVLGSNSSGQSLERGLQDEGMALYELLRHSRREGRVIPIERLRSLPGVESDWISYLVAQYLVEEIGGQAKTPTRMLSPLLAALALFPLKVTRAAFAITAGSEELREVARVLNAIMELGEVIARKGQPYEVQASLKHLALTLEHWKNKPRTTGLLARFVRFVYDPDLDSNGSENIWPRLLALLVEAKRLAEPSALQRLLFSPVANLLPSLPPGPDARLSEEAAWLLETVERLQILPRLAEEVDQQSAGTPTEQVWKPIYDEILSRARERMQHLCTVALDELRTRVRVHVRQRSARYLSSQLVQLELEAQPETLDRASNVRFEIALNIPGGLASVDKLLTFKEDIALLEKAHEARVFTCEGRLAPGQAEVQVRITVQYGDNKPFERLTSLRLSPFPVSSPTSRAPFPDALAARSRELVDELRRSKSGCRFVLLDESLGRSQLLSRAEGPGIDRVDLDAELSELGPGRPYPELLNLGNILAALRGEQVPAPGEKDPLDLGPGDPILVAPCDDFWDRLLVDSSLQNVLSSLLAYLSSYRGRSLTFVLDSRLGARLRRRPHRRIEWIAAYRLEDTESDKVREEAAQWLVGEAASVSSNRLGETALQRLGGDLRLGLQLRPLTRDQDLSTGTLDEILRSLLQTNAALEVLRADLEGLPPEAIHLLIVAACSQTTFRFTEAAQGLFAADTIYSTASGGRRGRPILAEGQRIDAHTLTSLRSDHEARSRTVAVVGFSSRRPCSIQERIEHLALFLGTDADVENMGKLLSGIGAAELHEGVILARSPFRELIRDAVQQKKPPAEVYQLLSGGPSPLAAWSLPLFARLTADKIQQIDTRIEKRQASMLQLLGAAWHAMAERRSFPETQLRRALDTLTGRDVAWVAGSGKTSDHLPRWEGDNWDLLFSLGEPQSQRETPYHLLILAAPPEGRPEAEPTPQLLEALTTVGTTDDEVDGQNKDQIRPSLLLVARPGGRAVANRERRWIELSDEELRTAALNPEWVKAFWGLVKTRAGLKALAPFKREGALPPGSPVFAGRDEELQYMMRHLRQRSFLIVGSRQVGKTSLLNELRFRVQNENDSGIACHYMDLQGISHSNELSGTLLDWAGNPEIRDLRSRELFTHLVELASKNGRFPVFLLNEVDKLLRDDVAFLWFLRGLHDANRAQFVMTGYTQAASSCQDPKSPFYHWTTSPDSKRKYLALAELTPRAAEKIIEVLEKSPLELVWEDPPQEKIKGQRLILDRSYRIPHLIQAICLGLVERLEKSRRYSLRHDDVVAVVNQREISAWDRVVNIDLSFAAPNLTPPELARTLVQLVLHVAMKNLYFSGARPLVQSQLLPNREPSTVTFSAEEVHRWLPQSLKGLLIASEVAEANKLINQVDIDAMLSALTLTLLLSYDLRTGRYFFPGHLYPRELQRNLRPGELIEDRIIELVLHFAYFLPGAGSSRPVPSVPVPRRETQHEVSG